MKKVNSGSKWTLRKQWFVFRPYNGYYIPTNMVVLEILRSITYVGNLNCIYHCNLMQYSVITVWRKYGLPKGNPLAKKIFIMNNSFKYVFIIFYSIFLFNDVTLPLTPDERCCTQTTHGLYIKGNPTRYRVTLKSKFSWH